MAYKQNDPLKNLDLRSRKKKGRKNKIIKGDSGEYYLDDDPRVINPEAGPWIFKD